jgi:hypothetical protein
LISGLIAVSTACILKIRGNLLYIADTNNHLVRIFDLDKKLLRMLPIKE